MRQGLIGPEVAFSGLYGGMPEQQLYLLQVSSRLPAKLSARSTEIVWRQLSKVRSLGVAHHQSPDCLLIPDLRPCKLAGFADRLEEAVFCNAGSFKPYVDPGLHAGRLPWLSERGFPPRQCRATRGQLKKWKFTYACMLDLWLTVSTLVSKTVLSFWSPHLLPTTRMNAWAESSPYPASASARWTPTQEAVP